jgi:hypothetical protein
MSTKRIKFLQRKKILQDHIRIALEQNGPVRRFRVELKLEPYGFPSTAIVWLEAKTLLQTLRFKIGTVGGPLSQAPKDISQLKSERVTFNILVLDPQSARKLGSAETVRPVSGDGLQDGAPSLLPVDLADDTSGLVWRIVYSDDDGEGHCDAPVLIFSRDAADGSAAGFVQDVAVRAMIMPEAMREVLFKVLVVDSSELESDSSGWRDAWLRLGASLAGEEPPLPESDQFKSEAAEWIDRAVIGLANKAQLLEAYVREQSS